MTREQAFRSVWAVIGSSAKSKQNMVVINMHQADDENSTKSVKMQWTAMIHPRTLVQTIVNIPMFNISSSLMHLHSKCSHKGREMIFWQRGNSLSNFLT